MHIHRLIWKYVYLVGNLRGAQIGSALQESSFLYCTRQPKETAATESPCSRVERALKTSICFIAGKFVFRGMLLTPNNYRKSLRIESTTQKHKKWKCSYLAEGFPEVEGEWRSTKDDAKELVAGEALRIWQLGSKQL